MEMIQRSKSTTQIYKNKVMLISFVGTGFKIISERLFQSCCLVRLDTAVSWLECCRSTEIFLGGSHSCRSLSTAFLGIAVMATTLRLASMLRGSDPNCDWSFNRWRDHVRRECAGVCLNLSSSSTVGYWGYGLFL